ncbi:MAG: NUDIX hydrolase [Candidatus Woesearchaeota archaeon]|nr:NUDIX hydrolase [Candidatus Woesearchaeota archaeon]
MIISKPTQETKQTVGCILTHQKKYLLLHRTKDNLWGSIAGSINHGETPEQTIRREIQEELSLIIMPTFFITTYHKYGTDIVAYHLFEHELTNKELEKIKLNEESSEFRLVSLEDALKLSLFEDKDYCLKLHHDKK